MKLTVIAILFFILAGCTNGTDNTIRERGVINEQGITSYQYGSHTFTNEKNFYALKSERIDLDLYIDKEVLIIGKLVHEGLSGGPKYYEVIEIEE